jgi:hypothetical protein
VVQRNCRRVSDTRQSHHEAREEREGFGVLRVHRDLRD